jgi:hypothetical protein
VPRKSGKLYELNIARYHHRRLEKTCKDFITISLTLTGQLKKLGQSYGKSGAV